MREQVQTSFGKLNRRQALGAGLGFFGLKPSVALAGNCGAKPGTVRDRFWLFGYPPGSDYFWTKKMSVMTPAEAAYYISVPNVVMVQVYADEAKYGRFEPPYERYAVALRPFKRVFWSIVGSGGFTGEEERQKVIELARATPNFTGVFMDDFFTLMDSGRKRDSTGKIASLPTDELAQIQKQLKGPGKKLELYAVLYTYQLNPVIVKHLNLIDVITVWTWDSSDLLKLESNLDKLERLAPKVRKILGIYTIDYPHQGRSVPILLMKHQCALGLKWLYSRRVEGLMFLGNGHYDIGFESVEWLRDWVRHVGDTAL